MDVTRALNSDDLRRMARRRLPRIVFDYIEGGVEDEEGLERNRRAFLDRRLVPRYLADVTERDPAARLFGRDWAAPFGIAPMGLAGLARQGADLILAEAARDADIPFVMSGAANASIEDLGRVAPEHGWYQLYLARDRAISEDMVRRARDAGLSTLVLTVDVPVHPKRERNRRNGFGRPLRVPLAARLDALRRPGWLAAWLRRGTPIFANWAPYAGAGANAGEVADFLSGQSPAPARWRDVEAFRRLWPGVFVLKGIMHPGDAARAVELGVDGVVVSNHGARQLDRAASPLEVLPAVRAAVGDRAAVMLDSGVRRGADVLVAMCLGAEFVFLGRPALYGAAAAGAAGARHAIAMLRGEIDDAMAQTGLANLRQLGPDLLLDGGGGRNAP